MPNFCRPASNLMNSQLGLGCRVGRDLICLLELTVWTKDKSESLSSLALLSKFKALSVTGSVKTTEINNTLKNLFFSIETHPMWRLSWRTSSKIKTIPGQNAFHLQTLTLHGSQCCLPAQSSQNSRTHTHTYTTLSEWHKQNPSPEFCWCAHTQSLVTLGCV